MALDERHAALMSHGWKATEADQSVFIHPQKVGVAIQLTVQGSGWMCFQKGEDGADQLVGHSRYGTKLADYLKR